MTSDIWYLISDILHMQYELWQQKSEEKNLIRKGKVRVLSIHKVHAHNLTLLQFLWLFYGPFAFLSLLAETGFVASQKRREVGRTGEYTGCTQASC